MARRQAALLVSLLVALHTSTAFDVEAGSRPLPSSRPPPGSAMAPTPAAAGSKNILQRTRGWYEGYQRFVAGAAKVSKLINMGAGAWLVITTPFSLLGSTFSFRLYDVILCAYLCGFGALMFGVELPVKGLQQVLRTYFLFAYTKYGRTGFMLLVCTLAWVCKHVGFLTKAFVLFNFSLNVYTLYSADPRFVQQDAAAAAAIREATEELTGNAKKGFTLMKALGFGKAIGNLNKEEAPTDTFPNSGGFQPSSGGYQPSSGGYQPAEGQGYQPASSSQPPQSQGWPNSGQDR